MKISSLIYELKQVRKYTGDIEVKIALGRVSDGKFVPIGSVCTYPIEVKRTDENPFVCTLEME